MMIDTQSAEDIIKRAVRSYFTREAIDSVLVTHETDADEDNVLKVTIVISDRFGGVDEGRILGLVRHIRYALAEQKQDDFPMVDFVSMAEARKMRLATA